MSDWVKIVVGPLGKLHADSAKILELIQDAADKEQEPDKEVISESIFQMVLDLHAVSKVVNHEKGSAELMKRWCEGFDSILEIMNGPIGDGPCPEATKEKMNNLVNDMKLYK